MYYPKGSQQKRKCKLFTPCKKKSPIAIIKILNINVIYLSLTQSIDNLSSLRTRLVVSSNGNI